MDVVLLGTGSADGWPNPFCTCASCNAARVSGDSRGQSSALIDKVLLIDCGPEIPRAAVRHGQRLDRVHTMLFTHAHPDHLGPAAFLFRHWAQRSEPLHVIGPPAVVAECEHWLAPDDPVTLTAVSPGDRIEHQGYAIRVVAATHEGPQIGPAVLFDITAPDGARLLYAADTGPLSEATYADIKGAAFDVALIEETFGDHTCHGTDHLDLPSFAQTLVRLRRDGAVTDTTQVVAIHLSHHNPPTEVLAGRLDAWGVQLLPDGASITAGTPAHQPIATHRTLVLGGARSGKSAHAERLLAAEPHVTYLATAHTRPDDEEWQRRVAAHRANRPGHWTTREDFDLAETLRQAGPGEVLLIDCVTMWLTQVLDESGAWDGDLALADKRIDELIDAWVHTAAHVVAVSNEVGWGVVPATPSGRLFRDVQGRVNTRLAATSDEVTLLVAGRALGLDRDATG